MLGDICSVWWYYRGSSSNSWRRNPLTRLRDDQKSSPCPDDRTALVTKWRGAHAFSYPVLSGNLTLSLTLWLNQGHAILTIYIVALAQFTPHCLNIREGRLIVPRLLSQCLRSTHLPMIRWLPLRSFFCNLVFFKRLAYQYRIKCFKLTSLIIIRCFVAL